MSGMKQMVINTQERAISTDINRLQKFKEQDVAELLRYWLDVTGNDDLTSGAIAEPSTLETPLRAEIVNGILAKPQGGSTNVFVDPGVIMVLDPDGTTDESNYKYVRDSGTTTPGALTIAAGAVGTRIDVVECRINAVDKIATDNRDIFNTTTGLFSATSVTKERAAQLEYRVRQGTPSGGFPGTVNGWLPILVASVPSTATDNDDVTFWDVRPLVSDRLHGAYALAEDWPLIQRANFALDAVTAGGELRLTGQFRGGFGARRLGGILRRGTPGTDADRADLLAAANLASGFAYAGTGFAYAYLLTPFSLPRWARYVDAPAARTPRSPRGILVVTDVAPNHLTGAPSAAVALPTSTGLSGTTSSGMVVTPIRVAAGTPQSALAGGTTMMLAEPIVVNETSHTAAAAIFTIAESTNYPANAKALYVECEMPFTAAADARYVTGIGGECRVEVRAPGTSAIVASVPVPNTSMVGATGFTQAESFKTGCIKIPLPTQYPGTPGASFTVRWLQNMLEVTTAGQPTKGTQVLKIYGYELGP